MSFTAYIARRRITDTPAGDFTADAKRDSRLSDVTTWPELKAYLAARRTHRDVIEAARAVWTGYARQTKKASNA